MIQFGNVCSLFFLIIPVCFSGSRHPLLANGMRRQEEPRVVKRQVPPRVPACGSQLPAMQPLGPPPRATALLDQRRTDGMKHQRPTEVNKICH